MLGDWIVGSINWSGPLTRPWRGWAFYLLAKRIGLGIGFGIAAAQNPSMRHALRAAAEQADRDAQAEARRLLGKQ